MILKYIYIISFCLTFIFVDAQKTEFIESDFHEQIYFNEENEQTQVLSADESLSIFGISDNKKIFTQRKTITEETLQFNILNYKYNNQKKETTLYMTDKKGNEYLAIINKEKSTLILTYINKDNKMIIDKYRISKFHL